MTQIQTQSAWYRAGRPADSPGLAGYDGRIASACFGFTTDAQGAAGLRFQTESLQPASGETAVPGLRWLVTEADQDLRSYCGGAGTACESLSGPLLGGSLSLGLLPNTGYRLWLFPGSARCGLWRIGGIRLSLEGSFFSPSTPEAPDGVFGRPLPIRLRRTIPQAVHTVTVDCEGLHTVLMTGNGVSPTVLWETALTDYAPLLPDREETEALITVESFCLGRSLGVESCRVTMRLPAEGLAPTLAEGWVSLSPYHEGGASGFSCLIDGVSRVEAVFDSSKVDPAGLLGATVTGYGLEALGQTVSQPPYRSGVIRGTGAVRCWVQDSRGRRHSRDFSIEPLPYEPPALSQIQVSRSGASARVSAVAACSSLRGANTCQLTAALRPAGGSFGSPVTLQSGTEQLFQGLDPEQSYECRLEVRDGLGNSAQALRLLPGARWAMKFRPDGRGVAFGMAPQRQNCLELPAGWEIRVGGESLFLSLHPVGSVVLGDSAPVEGTWTGLGAVAGTTVWRRTG